MFCIAVWLCVGYDNV